MALFVLSHPRIHKKDCKKIIARTKDLQVENDQCLGPGIFDPLYFEPSFHVPFGQYFSKYDEDLFGEIVTPLFFIKDTFSKLKKNHKKYILP